MATDDDPDEQSIVNQDRRESASDWMGLGTLVAALCIGFVALVAAGYGVRALLRAFG